ncbi:Diphthamide biosynthesis protein Dph2 [Blumeria hordei DH14]|uniref:2-(3-amino-3-carboxypropyl)histidine synthase subunit 2 n=1 Tax=Blumeria graminis f. sp. hordei (strain DH14) TaxID=546991 RepID=N1J5B0_BLUG1|nr:Diphthamide biosynthesis protein Dph2 [Blumeria hordei DH14]
MREHKSQTLDGSFAAAPSHASATPLTNAPILSTPEFDYQRHEGHSQQPEIRSNKGYSTRKEEIWHIYEIRRTIREIRAGGWKRVALQFPDDMLRDAEAVVSALNAAFGDPKYESEEDSDEKIYNPNSFPSAGLGCESFESKEACLDLKVKKVEVTPNSDHATFSSNNSCYMGVCNETSTPLFTELRDGGLEVEVILKSAAHTTDNVSKTENTLKPIFKDLGDGGLETDITTQPLSSSTKNTSHEPVRLYILADTSYGSCCVDEIAAQHVNADAIVHYGRSCLSPTSRLPVIYVFTTPPLDLTTVIQSFEEIFYKESKVILMADVIYHSYLEAISESLKENGYLDIIAPKLVRNPSSRIPNREIGEELELGEYSIFHIAEPSPALLLTLSCRVKEMFVFSTPMATTTSPAPSSLAIKASTDSLIRRRYAVVNSLNTCSIFGILINTLSVANHLEALNSIQALIHSAGKKYYTFVVGKVNAAKMANFSEIGGWVAIGCWESSLLTGEDFYRPVITPWELDWVLKSDKVRIWKQEWRGDFHGLGESVENSGASNDACAEVLPKNTPEHMHTATLVGDSDSEPESEPPEFDLRTGRYISHSRPLQSAMPRCHQPDANSVDKPLSSTALSLRARGDLAVINGTVSPGAEFLRSKRTWTGLGSDFQSNDPASTEIEIGRMGTARGYVTAEGLEKR